MSDLVLDAFPENGIGLYVIGERTSKTVVSGPIPAKSDLVALFGFVQYINGLDKDKEIKTQPVLYSLARVGVMAPNGKIVDTDGFRICTGDKAKEVYDAYVVQALQDDEE